MRAGILIAALLVSACNSSSITGAASGPPAKRQPGSWSTKVTIMKFEGPEATPEARKMMDGLFGMMSAMSVCVTPEAAQKEDLASNFTKLAGSGRDCKFERKTIAGTTIDVAGICGAPSGEARMTIKGTNTPTAQDLLVTTEDVAKKGRMELRIETKRNGECKAGDITPPAAPPADVPTGNAN